MPIEDSIGSLAFINNRLSTTHYDLNTHTQLNRYFLDQTINNELERRQADDNIPAIVFNRVANSTLLRNLLVYGRIKTPGSGKLVRTIGSLALHANEFLQQAPTPKPHSTKLEFAACFLDTWDLYNPRDIAHSLPRVHSIISTISSGTDEQLAQLRKSIGLSSLRIDGLLLSEFAAVAFGLYSYGLNAIRNNSVAFDPTNILDRLPAAKSILNRFLTGRAQTIDLFSDKLRNGRPIAKEQFLDDLNDRSVLQTTLSILRQHPLLKLTDQQVIILDLQFLADLLTTGSYWLVFDGLAPGSRNTFRELWGRAFELYVADLLSDFYPPGSAILRTDIPYANGQIDALLDFGPDVFVLETKASLLTESAKRQGNLDALRQDIERKFVINEKGKPKAITQLARTVRALSDGTFPTAMRPVRIYPVLVSDEPASECLCFNAHLNEYFKTEAINRRNGTRPLTVMSVDELEELLPYAQAGSLSWADVCESRFNGLDVADVSVHQAIYDLRCEQGLGVQQSDFMKQRFETAYNEILSKYRGAAGQQKGAKPDNA